MVKQKNVAYQEVLRSILAEKVIDVIHKKSIHEKAAAICQTVESMCVEKHNEEMGNVRKKPREEYIVTNNAAICEEDMKPAVAYDISIKYMLPLNILVRNESTENTVCNSSVRRIDNVTGKNNKKNLYY